MNRFLLVLLLLVPSGLSAQDNPNYNPDYDGNGCYSINDILGLLPLFGTCVDTTPAFPCGDSVLFDGYWYETVLIGEQCWFAENLRTTVYTNGDVIPAVIGDGLWLMTEGATTVYGDGNYCDSTFSEGFDACDEVQSLSEYGRLYNWLAVDDERGLCPTGWHVPADGEWTQLEDYITSQGFAGIEGTALKSTTGWSNNDNGTNDFGFSGLPSGECWIYGGFWLAGVAGSWWSSSSVGCYALYRGLGAGPEIHRGAFEPEMGRSLRCLRD